MLVFYAVVAGMPCAGSLLAKVLSFILFYRWFLSAYQASGYLMGAGSPAGDNIEGILSMFVVGCFVVGLSEFC